jgi:hypothetical protein
MNEPPKTERPKEQPLGAELQQLARAISLGNGFALYVLFCPSPAAARQALMDLHTEIARLEEGFAPCYQYQIFARTAAGDRLAMEQRQTIDALFGEEAQPAHYLVLNAAEAREDDEQALRFLFERLNERRNQLIERRQRPLLLVLPSFAEQLLAHAAPDLWSIRSLPAVFLKEEHQPPDAVRGAPAQERQPPKARSSQVTIALVYAEQDRNFALDIERHLQMWSVEGIIRFVHHSPGRNVDHFWRSLERTLAVSDLVVLLASPELFYSELSEMAIGLRKLALLRLPMVSILMRGDPSVQYALHNWETLPLDGKPLSLLRTTERDRVMQQLTQRIRQVVAQHREQTFQRPLATRPSSAQSPFHKAVPDRPTVRRLLEELLPTSADFDAFCMDYFPEIAHRFGGGMDRIQRTNLLLTLEEPVEILQRLGATRHFRSPSSD